jgi:hypothetical protein
MRRSPARPQFLGEGFGLGEGMVSVDNHGKAVCREILGDGPADPFRRARDERHTFHRHAAALPKFTAPP